MANKFVDCFNGNDLNQGVTWAQAWRTLDNALISANSGDVVWIKPGIYTLESTGKNLKPHSSISFVGLGGVIVRSIGPSAAAKISFSSSSMFQNIVFATPDIFDAGTNKGVYYGTSMELTNCDVANGVFRMEAGTTQAAFKFRFCSFEGITPPTAGASYNESWGPFAYVGSPYYLSGEYYKLNPVESCPKSEMGFLTNNSATRGANVVVPEAVQYNSLGTGFVSGELLPMGLVQRHDRSANTVDRRKFSAWCLDPSGPAGTLSFADDDAITLVEGDGVRALSPVYYYGMGLSLTRVKLAAVEFGYGGFNQVIDSTPADSTRTLEYRVSDTPFTQTELSPAWNTATRNVDVSPITGRYFQFRITFNLEAM